MNPCMHVQCVCTYVCACACVLCVCMCMHVFICMWICPLYVWMREKWCYFMMWFAEWCVTKTIAPCVHQPTPLSHLWVFAVPDGYPYCTEGGYEIRNIKLLFSQLTDHQSCCLLLAQPLNGDHISGCGKYRCVCVRVRVSVMYMCVCMQAHTSVHACVHLCISQCHTSLWHAAIITSYSSYHLRCPCAQCTVQTYTCTHTHLLLTITSSCFGTVAGTYVCITIVWCWHSR